MFITFVEFTNSYLWQTLWLDFFVFPRERILIIIKIVFRKDIIYSKSFYLSFFNHLIINQLLLSLSLRSSFRFVSSLVSTNRRTCRSNYYEGHNSILSIWLRMHAHLFILQNYPQLFLYYWHHC
ncbi:hypothetical protein H312_01486 [Anncaliia algerae PRA339]|uniref:Uncharacterized protein n=1 Tax=Anncaliia algerae PRA339 TaxID=1288291 RepID=A0A059F1S9_9MICR|nr:hypothetical protein H312_01486 [Anncaliia algerae PRA339]